MLNYVFAKEFIWVGKTWPSWFLLVCIVNMGSFPNIRYQWMWKLEKVIMLQYAICVYGSISQPQCQSLSFCLMVDVTNARYWVLITNNTHSSIILPFPVLRCLVCKSLVLDVPFQRILFFFYPYCQPFSLKTFFQLTSPTFWFSSFPLSWLMFCALHCSIMTSGSFVSMHSDWWFWTCYNRIELSYFKFVYVTSKPDQVIAFLFLFL